MPMFDDASFDLVTAYAIHHEMPPRIIAAIFKEAFRVLKPGGDMVMADVTRTGELDKMAAWRMDWTAKWGGEPFWRATAALDMEPMAREAGFVDVRGYHPQPGRDPYRSEEHTSELQSLMRISYADFCLKKKKTHN